MIKCQECENNTHPFENSNLCKECWIELNLKARIEDLEDRVDDLSSEIKKRQKIYDDFCEINEEITTAYETFEQPDSCACSWEKLKGLLAKADALLPHK